MSQLCYMKRSKKLFVLVAKSVDDTLLTRQTDSVDDIVERIHNLFTLRTIVHVPGLFRFIGLKIMKHDD